MGWSPSPPGTRAVALAAALADDRVRLTVDRDGSVREVELEYRDRGTIVVEEIAVSDIGPSTAPRPPWVDERLAGER